MKIKDQLLILNNFGLREFKEYIQDNLINKINKSDDIFDYKYIQSFYKKFLSSKKHKFLFYSIISKRDNLEE